MSLGVYCSAGREFQPTIYRLQREKADGPNLASVDGNLLEKMAKSRRSIYFVVRSKTRES